MRTATEQIEIFKFDELSDAAKDNVRTIWLRDEWWDGVFEDAKTIAALMGIDIDDIFFSGFCHQGKGACFTGSYSYKKGSVKAVKQHAPQDKELMEIAKALYNAQNKCFFSLSCSISHSGHYYHELCTSLLFNSDINGTWLNGNEHSQAVDIQDALRSFMQWIYTRLEREHDYLLSDECLIEDCEANDYEFTEDGNLY